MLVRYEHAPPAVHELHRLGAGNRGFVNGEVIAVVSILLIHCGIVDYRGIWKDVNKNMNSATRTIIMAVESIAQ